MSRSISWLIVAKIPLLISSRMTSAGLTASRSASSLTVMVAGSSMGPRSRGSATWTGPPPNAPSRRGGLRGPRRPRVPLLLLATGSSFGVRCGHVGWVVDGDGGRRALRTSSGSRVESSPERSAGDRSVKAGLAAAHRRRDRQPGRLRRSRRLHSASGRCAAGLVSAGRSGRRRRTGSGRVGRTGGRGPAYDDTSSSRVSPRRESLQLSMHRPSPGRRRLSWRARRASAWPAPRPRSRPHCGGAIGTVLRGAAAELLARGRFGLAEPRFVSRSRQRGRAVTVCRRVGCCRLGARGALRLGGCIDLRRGGWRPHRWWQPVPPRPAPALSGGLRLRDRHVAADVDAPAGQARRAARSGPRGRWPARASARGR